MISLYLILALCFHCSFANWNLRRVKRLSDPLGPSLSNSDLFIWSNSELNNDDYVTGSIWPKPQSDSPTGEMFTLASNNFQFETVGQDSDVLKAALVRYMNLTFPDVVNKTKAGLNEIVKLAVNVINKYEPLTLETDESYTLTVTSPGATLQSYTVWGALRGLETFSQLVYQDLNGLYLAKGTKIVDFPRFHHRGFHFDTSRHYLKLPVIFKFIDAMSYSKFNVLHWHVVDDQSFPFVSETFPSLSGKGAWNNKTHIYTPDDVQKIIEYARLRGVRVLPEFDTPVFTVVNGNINRAVKVLDEKEYAICDSTESICAHEGSKGHVFSWRSIPNLLTPCYSGGKPTGGLGPINPTLDSTYGFLSKFFEEVARRFPDQYLHLGGDEVPFGCWESNPSIVKWMEKMGFGKNFSLLEQYYETKLLKIIASLKKSYVIWQEVVDNNVKVLPDTVVNVWKGGWQAEMQKVTSKGLRAILSSPWYLNYISYGSDWEKLYKNDPQDFDGTDEQKKLVIGGTGCMWGEWVDGTNILSRTWARALAVGERLWSSKETTDVTDAANRIWEHRCRYVRRGIPAENVISSKFCRYEWPGY